MYTSHPSKKKWFVLSVIILMYLPVSIDATILHVAAPSLSIDLKTSSTEILWIIDIYSLVMACFLLPMGVLGDRYGVKKLALTGTIIFAAASYFAFISTNAIMLMASRALLALGAAMILPSTLAALRITFDNNKERAIALGIWSAVGTGGAALGPLVGGFLLQSFTWHSVFFINLPICFLVIILTLKMKLPNEKKNHKHIHMLDPALLISSILLIILFFKNSIKEGITSLLTFMLLTGLITGFVFVKRQITSLHPMIDVSLFKNRTVLAGIILALTSMISLVGFEFFVSQELQLAMGMSPLYAGLFLLPLILSSCLSGPFIGWTIDFIGVRTIAFIGVFLSSLSFAGMAFTNFQTQVWQAWALMIVLGFCIEAALLASTTAIMNSAPADKGGEAGAIEGMAYEFGAGIGVVIFGLLMSTSFKVAFEETLPKELKQGIPESLSSLSDAITHARKMEKTSGDLMLGYAKEAFLNSHFTIMMAACLVLSLLSLIVYFLMRDNRKEEVNSH
ncbi:TPA: MFS transporter [Enterobacter asburiae]